MDPRSTTAIVFAIVIAAVLLLFGGGMGTSTFMGGTMTGSAGMGGHGRIGLPLLLAVVVGIIMIAVLSGRK